MNLKFKKPTRFLIVTLLILILAALSFYWFEWRPVQVRAKCAESAADKALLAAEAAQSISGYVELEEFLYKRCVRKNGLEL